MDEQKKEIMEQQSADNENSEAQNNVPTRSYIIRILAGFYLLYTGYKLCEGVLKGEEGSGWGFMAAGIAFLVIAVVLLISSGRYFFQKGKVEKTQSQPEDQAQINQEEADTELKNKKAMSISERANLAKHLQEEENEANE